MTVLSKEAPREISGHRAHPQHKLKVVDDSGEAEFTCNGCRENGNCAGGRYRCEFDKPCNIDLHKVCALAEDTLVHPLFPNQQFKLRRDAPGPGWNERLLCDACGAPVKGWYYHCAKKGLDLHPCCAKLPTEIKHEDLTFELRKEATHRCSACQGSGGYMTFWYYRSTCKTVYLHVGCVKKEIVRRSNEGCSITGDMILSVTDKVLDRGGYRGEKSGTKFLRICKIVAAVLHIIIGTIIGDPTAIITALVLGATTG